MKLCIGDRLPSVRRPPLVRAAAIEDPVSLTLRPDRLLAASAPLPDIGALEGAVLHTGSKASLAALAGVAKGARERLAGELFSLSDRKVARAIRRAGERGVRTTLLADPEWLVEGRFARKVLSAPNTSVIPYGEMPNKVHVKALVADGHHAVVTTAAPITETRRDRSLELAFEFKGEAAAALDELTKAAFTGNAERIRAAAQAAARHGLVLNDAPHGVRLLTSQVEDMIVSARKELVIASKLVTDRRILALLADARARGVTVRLETREVSPRVRRFATDAGLPLHQSKGQHHRLHANVILKDGTEAYVGTLFLDNRPLGRASAGRKSRELGVVVRDPALIAQLRDFVASIPGARKL